MKAPDLKEKLVESEKLLKEMRKTWEEKLAETEKIHQVGDTQDQSCTLDKDTKGWQSLIYHPNVTCDLYDGYV